MQSEARRSPPWRDGAAAGDLTRRRRCLAGRVPEFAALGQRSIALHAPRALNAAGTAEIK